MKKRRPNLDHVFVKQEEPQKAVDRAVRIAQETAKRVQGVGLQSLMDQAKPTAKFKRE